MTDVLRLNHTSRRDAVILILAAFRTAAADRVNTHPEVTMAQAGLALRALGVTPEELRAADAQMGGAT